MTCIQQAKRNKSFQVWLSRMGSSTLIQVQVAETDPGLHSAQIQVTTRGPLLGYVWD